MISGGYRCPLYDDDAAVTTTDLGSDQATRQLDSALRGPQAAERHDYLGPARERGRAELSIPLPIVVVVRGVVAALEPGYSSFVIAGENSAVIEAGEAPRHGVHFTGPSREDHTTQVTYRAPGWAASSACRWVTW